MGRIPVTVTGKLAQSLRVTERLKSAEFLAIEGKLATISSHNTCNDLLNLITRRCASNNDLVNYYTEYEDVVRIGDEIESIYSEITYDTLTEYKIPFDADGKVTDMSALVPQTMSIKNPHVVYSSIINDPEGLNDEEKELWHYVNSYNANKEVEYQIHGTFSFESDLSQVCYICVDDVLVHRQNRAKLVRKNGKWVVREVLGEWIYHSVGYVEYDDKIYLMEAPTQEKIYARILAFLLKNDLQDKYLVIFTDGEEALKKQANEMFKYWPHQLYLDYYHLKENLEERFSRIFRPGKIIDDTVPVEYFKNGKVKKSSIQWITRSQYHLRTVISMLWAGNVDMAIKYLEILKGTDEIKAGGDAEIDRAVRYLKDKRDRIPCYALRKHLELRNTSNSVEIANNALVSRRQKKKGTAWSDDGSFAVSGITVVFENGDAEKFFTDHIISFRLREKATDRERKTGLEWIGDANVEIHVSRAIETVDDAA